MSDNNLKRLSLVESTHRIRWEITREEFASCEFPDKIMSPKYAIAISGKKSQILVRMQMHPKGDEEKDKNEVLVSLKLNTEDQIYKARYQFVIETQDGHWPIDFVKKFYSRSFGDSDSFFGHTSEFDTKNISDSWGYCLCSTENFREYFIQNKVTVVANFIIYEEGESYHHHMEVADDFMYDIRSMSSLDSLSDFTIVSDDTRFPCHRNVLAARSKYFEALFRNEPAKKVLEVEEPPELVEAMLEFISKGLIPDDIDDKAMDLIMMSDMYGLDRLTVACETSLVNNLEADNAVEILLVIDKVKHVSKVEHRQKVLDYIKKEMDQVVKVKDWKKFVQTYPDLFTEILLNCGKEN